MGVLTPVESNDQGSILRIDAWVVSSLPEEALYVSDAGQDLTGGGEQLAGGYENTTFVNGTTY